MERRIAKMNISSAGGTASSGSRTCKVTLPTSWVEAMGLDENHRELELAFDGTSITLSRRLDGSEFAAQQLAKCHEVRVLRLYDGDTLCSTIYADFTGQTLAVENQRRSPGSKPPLETTRSLPGRTSNGSLRSAASHGNGPDCGSIWRPWGWRNTTPLPLSKKPADAWRRTSNG